VAAAIDVFDGLRVRTGFFEAVAGLAEAAESVEAGSG